MYIPKCAHLNRNIFFYFNKTFLQIFTSINLCLFRLPSLYLFGFAWFCFVETSSCERAKASLKLKILLPPRPEHVPLRRLHCECSKALGLHSNSPQRLCRALLRPRGDAVSFPQSRRLTPTRALWEEVKHSCAV